MDKIIGFVIFDLSFSFVDKYFSFILLGVHGEDDGRGLINIFHDEDGWIIDLFWKKIIGGIVNA